MPSKQSTFPIVFPRCFPGGSLYWVPIQMLPRPWIEPWKQIRCEIAKHADTPATACLCTQNPWTQTYPCIFWTLYSYRTEWSKEGRNKAGAETNRSKWHDSHDTQKYRKAEQQAKTRRHYLLWLSWLDQNCHIKLRQKQDDKSHWAPFLHAQQEKPSWQAPLTDPWGLMSYTQQRKPHTAPPLPLRRYTAPMTSFIQIRKK